MTGELTTTAEVSSYQESEGVRELTKHVRKDFDRGFEILHTPWPELNDYSVINRTNRDQRTANSFVDESVEDPGEAWKWRGTRSLARNKMMAMHAHLTSQYVVPAIFAQNENQEEDKVVSEAMGGIIEWMTVNSTYRPEFLAVSMGMLVNPVTYLEADYCEVYQTIKEKTEQGYKTREILDEVASGFQPATLGPSEVLITNAYVRNIQRQRVIIKRRHISYQDAEAKYKDHYNWGYVQPGVRTIYNDEDGLFYDVKDDSDERGLLEEVTFLNRLDDTEVCFVNGIYFGNEDVDWNPIRHRDQRGAPKYNVVPFGYERIGENYYFYKSFINRVGWDDQLIDAMYQVTMNREFLDLEMPVAISGDDEVDSKVIWPGSQIASASENFKVTPIIPPRTTNPYNALKTIEDSMSEASISDSQMGQLPEASQKAYSVAQANRTAKILLSGAAKSLAESVRQFGDIMVDIALNHLTVPQYSEIVGETGMEKYMKFVLENQTVNGRKVSKEIRFDEAIVGREMSEDDIKKYEMKLMAESGYPNVEKSIIVLNPHLFSKMRYLIRVEADDMLPKNKEWEKMLAERFYSLLRADPLINAEELVKELVSQIRPGATDRLIAKKPMGPQGLPVSPQDIQPMQQGQQGQSNGSGAPNLPPVSSDLLQQTGVS